MTKQELNEIIDIRKEELINLNYSYSFYCNLTSCWNKLLEYLEKNDLTYNDNSKNHFLELQKNIVKPKQYNYVIHAIESIDGLDKIVAKRKTSRIIRKEIDYNHSKENLNLINLFLKEVSEYNKERTIKEKKIVLNQIISDLENIGLNDCSKITRNEIDRLKEIYLKFDLYSNKKRYQWVLKDFLKFLFNNGYINTDYSILFDSFKKTCRKLPTIWTKEEIEKIVNNLGSNTDIEIRNKAMVLLAIRLGIRFIDIKNLCFDNINWKENKICFVQQKTNKYLELPLPEEVGNAIINYIKNARPKSKEKYIFITHDQYNKQLSESSNLNTYLLETYKKAKIDYESKNNKGIHTFRHSLASNMLESGIPLDIISSTLGHANRESTKVYIGVGYNLLKQCCLDIPEVLR